MKPIFRHHSTVPAGRRCAGLMLAMIVSLAALMPSAALAQEPVTAPVPEVVVGDLTWRVLSLRVTQPGPDETYGGRYSKAIVTLEIHNSSQVPVALNYVKYSGRVIDDRGYVYEKPESIVDVQGVGIANKNEATSEYVVASGGKLTARITLPREFRKGETVGNSFDFSADFLSVEDLGEGRLRHLRRYPVSFIGLQKAGIVQGQVEEVGGQLKKAFGSIFK